MRERVRVERREEVNEGEWGANPPFILRLTRRAADSCERQSWQGMEETCARRKWGTYGGGHKWGAKAWVFILGQGFLIRG